ncbi:serine/arginine repetitive matrix protein 3-like [Physeter macrocephalus]|uniref:Serine/arginine repetitive matrix protein 3-like n=1 Tax=Physeter macrocephalus TaxID=9755 RepID=A0A9W2WAV6_PHYMC|nr:serine/arginine repetitive matrix protein 3-like [Physeter catodon]
MEYRRMDPGESGASFGDPRAVEGTTSRSRPRSGTWRQGRGSARGRVGGSSARGWFAIRERQTEVLDQRGGGREGGWEVEPPGGGGAAGSGARPLAPTALGARVWAVTQKAAARSRAPGGGVRLRARRAAGQVGRLPRVRAGSWGCRRRRRRAPRARPAALGVRLAERVAGAPGPPGDAAAAAAAAAVAASVGSAGARCGEGSVSFGFSALSLLGRGRREKREGMSAPPRRPRPELGKLERGGAAWLNKAQAQLCFLLVSLLPPKRVPFPLDVITQKGVKGTR